MKYIILLIFSFIFVSAEAPHFNPNIEKSQEEDIVLSKESLVKIMTSMGIQHVDIVLAQAILESGTFSSRMFKTKNNMFGMKVPSKRQTTAINKNGYASYVSWIDCVKDYKLYQDYVTKNKIISKSKYLSIISKSYAESPEYISKIIKIANQNKKYI